MENKSIPVNVVRFDENGIQLDNGLCMNWAMAERLGITKEQCLERAGKMEKQENRAPPKDTEVALGDPPKGWLDEENKWVHSENIEQYKKGVGRKDYPQLAEAFRRNIELGMALLEKRATGKGGVEAYVFPEPIRIEAEALIKENLLKLRAMTT